MESNDLLKKIQEISVAINNGCDLQYLKDNMKYIVELGKLYNGNVGSLSQNTMIQSTEYYQIFSKYLIMYMAKKYNKHFKYQLMSDNLISNFSNNTISLSKNMIGRTDFEHIMFTIFHEFRHKMQDDDITNILNGNNILSIDPSAFILVKEIITHNDAELYDNNHNCFIAEHDANLFSLSECSSFIDIKQLKEDYRKIGETINYINAMLTGLDISDEEFHDKQSLPIIYEQDYRFKNFFKGKQKPSNSLLSIFYDSNGNPKTYQELLGEKKRLIEKFKGQTVNSKSSTTNYEQWSNPKRAEEHIEEIFKLIIASDPILTLQEYLSKYNLLKDQIVAKQWMNKINVFLERCPQLIDIYNDEITNIFRNELLNGNIELVQNIIDLFPDKNISHTLKSIITVMNVKPISKHMSSKKNKVETDDDYIESELNEENLPYGAKKEEHKKTSFSIFKPLDQQKYAQQQKSSNGKKTVEHIIRTNNSSQFVEYEEENNQEMEEEDGMSL